VTDEDARPAPPPAMVVASGHALALAVAASAWLGAWSQLSPSRGVVVLVGLVAWRWRHPVGWLVLVALVAAHAGGAARDGLGGLAPGAVAGEVTLLGDPRPVAGAVVVEVRLGRHHVELRAAGSAGGALRDRLAGERVRVVGAVRPSTPAERHPGSHVAGTLSATSVEGPSGVWPPAAPVNALHRLLARGTDHLARDDQAVVAGLLVGDDRFIPADVTDDLRGAGLSHLLAVSGQNVAFLLLLASPLVARCPGRWRAPVTLGVIVAFVLLTRAEPSVLRAAAMTGIGVTAASLGRPLGGIRVLALGVAGLIVVDPFLVHRLGFALSVAAAAGIVVAAAPVADRLRGPSAIREAVSVTVAAQAAVTPLLLANGLSVPVVGVLANLPAAPLAGLVMTWGLTAGTVAGIVGGPVAVVVHVPTLLAVRGLMGIARLANGLPLGSFAPWHLAVVGMGVLLAWTADARRGRRLVGGGLVVVAVAFAALAAPAVGPGSWEAGPGVQVWRGGGTVLVVDGRAQDAAVLAVVRRAGIRRIDLLVVRSTSPRALAVAGLVQRRLHVASVVAPASAGEAPEGQRWTSVDRPSRIAVGDLDVAVVADGDRLDVTVHCRPGGRCPDGVG